MKGTTWLVQRAALALLLMVSFYALALGLAAALLWIPYEAYANGVRLPGKLVLLCVAFALIILWAILPRFDRFVPPGPSVTAAKEPVLFSLLEEVAAATGQAMPSEVYLVNDVNAFVAERGGVMGVGSRRVMGLGLPLMQAVTVQEFKGIVAHEFGHYHAGDVKIGPWIYKTRAAIGRTIEKLSNTVLQKVFIWYGELFLRLTHAVSRRQEFTADEIAAGVAGAGVMASALRKVHGAAVGFQGYWNSELGPVLDSGFLPPITAGFARFIGSEHVRARLEHAVRAEEADGQADSYDTHPPLRERVAALSAMRPGEPGDVRPAVALLADPGIWERRILAVAINEDWARSLKPLTWDQVVETVYVPRWRAAVQANAAWLRGVTPGSLPFAGALAAAQSRGGLTEADQAVIAQVQTSGAALSLLLYETGWATAAPPRGEIVFTRNDQEVRPLGELLALADGRMPGEAWSARCAALGIEHLPLEGRPSPQADGPHIRDADSAVARVPRPAAALSGREE